MKRFAVRAALPILVLLASAGHADAHIVASRLGDFYAGALHPLTDLQELVIWLALGLLAGALGDTRGRWLVILFPIGLAVGVRLGMATAAPAVTDAVAAAAVLTVLGVITALALRLPGALIAVLAFAIAVMRGMANGSGLPADTDPLLFAVGLAGAGYVVLTLVLFATVAFAASAAPWRRIAVRAGGSWIAAVGLMMTAFALIR